MTNHTLLTGRLQVFASIEIMAVTTTTNRRQWHSVFIVTNDTLTLGASAISPVTSGAGREFFLIDHGFDLWYRLM
jgi:hypothetical protein